MQTESGGKNLPGGRSLSLLRPREQKSGAWRDDLDNSYLQRADGNFINAADRRVVNNLGQPVTIGERPAWSGTDRESGPIWRTSKTQRPVKEIGFDLFATEDDKIMDGRGQLVDLTNMGESRPRQTRLGEWKVEIKKTTVEPIGFKTQDGRLIDNRGLWTNSEAYSTQKEHDLSSADQVFPMTNGLYRDTKGQSVTPYIFRDTTGKYYDGWGRLINDKELPSLFITPSDQTVKSIEPVETIKKPAPDEIKEVGQEENVARSLENLKDFAKRTEPEPPDVYERSCVAMREILERGNGIVELDSTVPTIVVSDLHARRDFLINLLERQINIGTGKREKIFDLLEQGKINIVCVGDGMHSETPALWWPASYNYDQGYNKVSLTPYGQAEERANQALEKIKNSDPDRFAALNDPSTSEAVFNQIRLELLRAYEASTDPDVVQAKDEYNQVAKREKHLTTSAEVARSLGTMKMIMDLKSRFPEHFHFSRGNHEDANGNLRGDIGKGGIEQSKVMREWLKDNFGERFFEQWMAFENSLPILTRGKKLVISHAAPGEIFTENDIAKRKKRLSKA